MSDSLPGPVPAVVGISEVPEPPGHSTDDDPPWTSAARAALRAQRGSVRPAGWGQVLQDWYVGVVVAGTVLVMIFAGTGGAVLTPNCSAGPCLDGMAYRLLAAAMAVSGVVGVLWTARLAGPLGADPAQMSWLLSAPADRAVLLRGRAVRSHAVGALVGCLWGMAVGLTAAGGSGALAGVLGQIALAGLGGAALAAVLVRAAQWRQGGNLRTAASARSVTDSELARAGALGAAAAASVVMLDTSAIGAYADRRRVARAGRFSSRVGRGQGPTGLLGREVRAMLRRGPGPLGLAVLGLTIAMTLGLVLGHLVGLVAVGYAAFSAAHLASYGLRALATSPGLRRGLPQQPYLVAAALALPACALAAGGTAGALAGMGLPWWGGLMVGPAAVAGVMRASDPLPPGLGLVVSSPAGPVPTGLMLRLIHGPDVVIVTTLLVPASLALPGLSPLFAAIGPLLLVWQLARLR